MINKNLRLAIGLLLSLIVFTWSSFTFAGVQGIYLTQSSVEDTALLNYFIKNAKAVGIDTFVADLEISSKRYEKNIALLKENNIKYIARIIMFPGGGTHKQITEEAYWQRKYKLVEKAIAYGAQAIQLDYIRYNTKSGSSPEHAKNVAKILTWYKEKVAAQKIPLEIDVFGISSYGEESHIGQNIAMFSKIVDGINPMVYPSHYTPFIEHFKTPYKTVYDSLSRINKHYIGEDSATRLIAYIELSNYHYPLSQEKKMNYIKAQLKAVKDANADGWYAWSANNKYDTLFKVLGGNPYDYEPKTAENIDKSKIDNDLAAADLDKPDENEKADGDYFVYES